MKGKAMKKIISLLIALLCLVSVTAVSFAEPTTYTIRLYTGDPQTGTFLNGGNVVEQTGIPYRNPVTFNISGLSVNPKYYAKGIRPAGRDNLEYVGADTAGNVSTVAERDMDYVVAYGIVGSQVSYTIVILNIRNNNELTRVTYYGDIGDTPVITLPYVDGFTPPGAQARIPSPLTADSSANVYYVRYTPISTTTVIDGGGGGGGNPNPNPNPDQNQNPDNTPAQPEVVAPPPPIDNYQEVEILDQSTPLAEFEDVEGSGGGLALPEVTPSPSPTSIITVDGNGKISLPPWAMYSTIGLLAVMIGLLYWYLLFYRKKKKYASMNEEDYDFSDLDLDEFDDFSK